MNKFATLMVLILYLVLITIVAGSVSMTTTTDIIGGISVNEEASILSVFGFLGTFFRILTFQITELPILVYVIFIYPPVIGILYMIIDVVKDIIPFT
jgi:hypothetical protein